MWKQYLPSVAAFLVGIGVDISGYQNFPLAVGLWVLSCLLLIYPLWSHIKRLRPRVFLKLQSQVAPIEFLYTEKKEPFEIKKHDNPNITIIKIGVQNLTQQIIRYCYVRIEKIQQGDPSSLFNLFDKAKHISIRRREKSAINWRWGC